MFDESQPFTPQILILTHQEQTTFENIVGKGEIAHNEQFLLLPQCFLLYQISVSTFVHIFVVISLFVVELEESKIGVSGKGLMKKIFKSSAGNLFLRFNHLTLSQTSPGFYVFAVRVI